MYNDLCSMMPLRPLHIRIEDTACAMFPRIQPQTANLGTWFTGLASLVRMHIGAEHGRRFNLHVRKTRNLYDDYEWVCTASAYDSKSGNLADVPELET